MDDEREVTEESNFSTEFPEESGEADIPPSLSIFQLIRNNAIAFSNEFTYSTETALVVPLLLKMNFPEKYYSLTYFFSPVAGFITSPLLGSLSDRCKCSWGRRRPFILGLSFIVMIGLTCLLNGEAIGYSLGDTSTVHTVGLIIAVIGQVALDYALDCTWGPIGSYKMDVCNSADLDRAFIIQAVMSGLGGGLGFIINGLNWKKFNLEAYFYREEHSVYLINSVIFIICVIITLTSIKEKPVSVKEKRTVTEIAPEYDSEKTPFLPKRPRSNSWSHSPPNIKGGWKKIRALNYKQMMDHQSQTRNMKCPTSLRTTDYGSLKTAPSNTGYSNSVDRSDEENEVFSNDNLQTEYFPPLPLANSTQSLDVATMNSVYKKSNEVMADDINDTDEQLSLKTLLISLITFNMPTPLRHLVASMFFGWLGMCAIYLFFTDFVAQTVFNGSPTAAEDSEEYKLYNDGVKYACWGMCIFSFTTAIYSLALTKLIKFFSIHTLYIWGFLIFACGTGVIAMIPNKTTCLLLTFTFGILFTTLYTMPYTLLNRYMSNRKYLNHSPGNTQRTHGIDIGILQSQMFIAMIVLSASIAPLIDATGSRLVIPIVASLSGLIGAFHAAIFVVFDVTAYYRRNSVNDNNNVDVIVVADATVDATPGTMINT